MEHEMPEKHFGFAFTFPVDSAPAPIDRKVAGFFEATVGTPDPELVFLLGLTGPAEGTLPTIQEQSEPVTFQLFP
jgi:hypothetical protein